MNVVLTCDLVMLCDWCETKMKFKATREKCQMDAQVTPRSPGRSVPGSPVLRHPTQPNSHSRSSSDSHSRSHNRSISIPRTPSPNPSHPSDTQRTSHRRSREVSPDRSAMSLHLDAFQSMSARSQELRHPSGHSLGPSALDSASHQPFDAPEALGHPGSNDRSLPRQSSNASSGILREEHTPRSATTEEIVRFTAGKIRILAIVIAIAVATSIVAASAVSDTLGKI